MYQRLLEVVDGSRNGPNTPKELKASTPAVRPKTYEGRKGAASDDNEEELRREIRKVFSSILTTPQQNQDQDGQSTTVVELPEDLEGVVSVLPRPPVRE